METLHNLLVEYNINSIPAIYHRSWSIMFQEKKFPTYWETVYNILNKMDKSLSIPEIGAGQGDITSILCYLGFSKIASFERDKEMANIAISKIQSLFQRTDVIINADFPNSRHASDVLIIVNCVYADGVTNKLEYKDKLKSFYEFAGFPKTVLLEVIDSTYTQSNPDFPSFVRLSQEDIYDIFPIVSVETYKTYQYPINKTTKYLYHIRTKQ